MLGITDRLPSINDLLQLGDAKFLNGSVYGSWKLYKSGTTKEIASFDSFLGYDYSDDMEVPSYPVEEGSFTNYNKIADPAVVKITAIKTGFPVELRNTLEAIEKAKESLDLYDIVLPFKTYIGYNLKSLNHAIREGDSVNMLVCELTFIEIKQTSLGYKTTSFSSKKVSNGNYADTKDSGRKQTDSSEEATKKKSYLKSLVDWI